MAKLIDKDALVAELKKVKQNLSASPIVVIEDVESLVESLEVKEVDLEKEATRFVQTKEFAECEESPVLCLAKHFFELGLKVNNEKEK